MVKSSWWFRNKKRTRFNVSLVEYFLWNKLLYKLENSAPITFLNRLKSHGTLQICLERRIKRRKSGVRRVQDSPDSNPKQDVLYSEAGAKHLNVPHPALNCRTKSAPHFFWQQSIVARYHTPNNWYPYYNECMKLVLLNFFYLLSRK